MGIRFIANSWRAPLQLIDSWLPTPTVTTKSQVTPKLVQMFARAGWLGRTVMGTSLPVARPAQADPVSASPPCRVRVLRKADAATSCRSDARVVISGRISDVCAELERLAALENQTRRTKRG